MRVLADVVLRKPELILDSVKELVHHQRRAQPLVVGNGPEHLRPPNARPIDGGVRDVLIGGEHADERAVLRPQHALRIALARDDRPARRIHEHDRPAERHAPELPGVGRAERVRLREGARGGVDRDGLRSLRARDDASRDNCTTATDASFIALRDEDATGCDHSWVFLRDSPTLVSVLRQPPVGRRKRGEHRGGLDILAHLAHARERHDLASASRGHGHHHVAPLE